MDLNNAFGRPMSSGRGHGHGRHGAAHGAERAHGRRATRKRKPMISLTTGIRIRLQRPRPTESSLASTYAPPSRSPKEEKPERVGLEKILYNSLAYIQ